MVAALESSEEIAWESLLLVARMSCLRFDDDDVFVMMDGRDECTRGRKAAA